MNLLNHVPSTGLGLEKPAPPEGQGIAKGRALLVADEGDVTLEELVKVSRHTDVNV